MTHTIRMIFAACMLAIFGCGSKTASPDALPGLPFAFDCVAGDTSMYEIAFDLTVPDADWATEENESVTARLLIDGAFSSHLVLPGGTARWQARALSRKPLEAGTHRIQLEPDPERSRSDSTVEIHTSSCKAVAAQRPPLLVGRNGLRNAYSDVPLGMYRIRSGNQIEYNVIFSNEDGGTGAIPAMLLAQWGRLIDTEWIWQYDGSLTDPGVFQSAGHGTKNFDGTLAENRPVFETATSNNNFSAWQGNLEGDLKGHLLFSLPLIDAPADVEAKLLEAYPQWQELSNLEQKREHDWEDPPDPSSWELPDLRKILWVDYTGDDLPVVALVVQTVSGTYRADRGQEDFRVSGSNFRTGVEIPEGEGVQKLLAESSSTLTGITGSFRLFELTDDYTAREVMSVRVKDLVSP